MIDVDQSGSLDKAVVKAVKTDQKVIKFLVNCGNQNLQYLLVPARLEAALNVLDTDRDGEISGPEWEEAIESALANKLEARAAKREAQAKAARKEIEEFTKGAPVLDTPNDGELDVNEWEDAIQRGLAKRLDDLANERERRERAAQAEDAAVEFLSAARQVFDAIDVDQSGSLDKAEVVKAVKTDQKVIKFLVNCGNQNLPPWCRAPRSRAQRVGHGPRRRDQRPEWEEAIESALANKLEARAAKREAQAKAARKEIEEFTIPFVPRALEKALQVLDTPNDGELDVNEWEDAIQRGLAKRLDDLANERERRERAAQAEDEAFSVEFLSAARQVFDMIDVDQSGSLDKAEVVKAVKTDQKVIKFLVNCGNQNLPRWCPRLAALVLDTDRDGEISGPEWEALSSRRWRTSSARAAKREAQAKAARKEIEEFTADFVNARAGGMIDKDGSGTLTKVEIVKAVSEDPAVVTFLKNCGEENLQFLLVPARLEKALEVFDMMDADQSGSLDKGEVVKAVQTDQKVIKFLVNCGNPNLQYLLVPARLEAALAVLDTDRDGEINGTEWEEAIETALANKLEARAAQREQKAKAARKEIEEFTGEFLSAARRCFQMIDKDGSGTLTKVEIVKAIAEDADVVKFLQTCGEENLQFLLRPARLEKALEVLDTSNDGELDVNEWEDAIHRGLAKRLDELANERERRERAAAAADEEFSSEFLSMARQTDERIRFLKNCGNENLQYLLVPERLEAALNQLDTDRDGEISGPEWEEAIESALQFKLEARAIEREEEAKKMRKAAEAAAAAEAKAAEQEVEEFTMEFLTAAKRCFEMIDKDNSGTLTKTEIVKAVAEDEAVVKFLRTCGEENLQFLLQPRRLEKALEVLDTSKDGEVDAEEWEEAVNRGLSKRLEQLENERQRRLRAAKAADQEFSVQFLSMARQVFDMIDVDQSGSLDKAEVVKAVQTNDKVIKFLCFEMIDKDGSGTLTKTEIVKAVSEDESVVKFLRTCGEENLQFLLVPARLEKALEVLDTSKDGEVDVDEWEEAIHRGLAKRMEELAVERERRDRAAAAEDEAFSVEFLSMARQVFDMIDVDGSGSLDKAEVVKAVKGDQKVINGTEWEGAIETALANKLEVRAAKREEQAKAARKEIEEFTNEFVSAARKCFEMIDKDNSGTLTKVEIVLDTPNDGELDVNEWEDAIQRGLAKRLDDLANERERRERAAQAEDEAFSVEFLSAARQVFDMIDVDGSGSLDKAEVVKAVKTDQKVIKFLVNCGNQNLQYLLVRARLEAALNVLDTDRDGEISGPEWEEAIESALANKLEARAAKREAQAKAARKEIEEFTADFVNAARKCFEMIDKDGSGTLTKVEIVKAVSEDPAVVTFLKNCGEENLQFLLVPARLEKALEVLDTSNDGEVDIEEWEEAIYRGLNKRLEQLAIERERRERAAQAEDEAFSPEFLSMARQVFDMMDADQSGSLDKGEVVKAVQTDQKVIKFLVNCGNPNLQYLLVPARLEAALAMIDKDGSGTLTKVEIVKAIAEDADAVKFLRGEATCALLRPRARRRRVLDTSNDGELDVFDMIDVDQSGSLDKAEVVKAVQTDDKCIRFLKNCGNENLQYLLVPARLEAALNQLDTDRDGEISGPEWEEAIESALQFKLEARAIEREEEAKKMRKAAEAAAAGAGRGAGGGRIYDGVLDGRRCFEMIDKDNSGTLTKTEIVKAPRRLEKALEVLDTSKDGEVDAEEWEEAVNRGLSKRLEQLENERQRRLRAAKAADQEFSVQFLSMARQVFDMIDVDQSGSLDKAEVVKAVQTDKKVFDMIDVDGSGSLDKAEVVTAIKTDQKVIKFLVNCGNPNLQYLLVPARLEHALAVLDTDRDGEISGTEWEGAIETALANKLEARAAQREEQAKAARKEIEEFTGAFLSAARQCFQMIDKDNSGTLTKAEIIKAIAEDKDVVKFLKNCGEENLQFLLRPKRLEKALDVLDASNDGELDIGEWEDAIHRGLAKRLDELANERERRERAALAEDEAFSTEFLSMARQVFDMMDADQSGALDKAEVVKAVKTDKAVIKFLVNCGNENLQYLLVPARLEAALNQLDTDRDGEISGPEWEEAIESALANKLEARAAKREAQAKAARKEMEEFTQDFVNAAIKCFEMIDKDGSGTLTKVEIVKAVAEDPEVVEFLRTCGEDNLQFLLMPKRLEKALQVLDTSNDGEVDVEEWEEAIYRGLSKRLEQLSIERERRERWRRGRRGAEVIKAIQHNDEVIAFLINCGNQNLQYLLVPARLESALAVLDTDRDGEISGTEWEEAIETALANKLEARAEQRKKDASAARKEIAEFTAEFMSAARECFEMIDEDDSGTLTKKEIKRAVQTNDEVISFLKTCGEENLQFLLKPKRIDRALNALDTSNDGELDIEEWEEAIYRGLASRFAHLGEERERRERAARAEDEKFTMEFLMAAREVYDTVDEDGSGTLNKSALVGAVNDANALLGGEAAAPSAAPQAVGPTVVRNVDADGVAFFIDTATGERTATLPDGATATGKKLDAAPEGAKITKAPAVAPSAPPPAPAPAVVEIVDPETGETFYVDQATGAKMDAKPEGATVTKAPVAAAPPPVVAAPPPAVVEIVDPATGEAFYVDQATGRR
ncbi:hypothetical protein JL720_13499 [Aureococcus anophagefferens]|nr:hypothetical protein JL720_13499 [Aureococcus anophagefferens]